MSMFLISDLDGTLLDRNKKIPSNALDAVRRFVNQGGLFTVATGRTEDTCRLATDILPINEPAILYNGAAVMELKTKQVIYQRTLDGKAFRPMVRELMERFPDICVELFAYGPLVLVNQEAKVDPYILREHQPYRYQKLEETPKEWLKIMLSAPHGRLLEAERFLEGWWPRLPGCHGFYSAEYYYEIIDRGCSKGDCARFLGSYLGIPQEEFAAIGDHLNDIEILRWANYAYAPRNARPEVKEVAQVLARTNEEGAICEAIDDLLLSKINIHN